LSELTDPERGPHIDDTFPNGRVNNIETKFVSGPGFLKSEITAA